MINAYIVAPKDLVLCTDTTPTLNPLAFSAAQLRNTTGMPMGITAVAGKIYIGSPDELPIFVRSNTSADILDKPTTTSVAYGDFVISGIAILIAQHTPREDIPHSMYLRPLDRLKRVVIGLLDDGNLFVVFCTATIEELKGMLCAYDVNTAMLIASGDVYFNNPRNGITQGEQPIVTLQATYYEELQSPVVIIDAAHGGSDLGNTSLSLCEKDLTLAITKEMLYYLKHRYSGTFIPTRVSDEYLSKEQRINIINGAQADFSYECHINALYGSTRGFECIGYSDASELSKRITTELYTRLQGLLEVQGIQSNGLTQKSILDSTRCRCPTFIAKTLYIDNMHDYNLLLKPGVLRMLGEIQAEALAYALGLKRRTEVSKISNNLDDTRYRVNVGEFPFQLGAIELCEKLQRLGFDAYITKD